LRALLPGLKRSTGHLELLSRRDVYEQIARWLASAE
jgi:hypothetical protein